MTLDPGSLGYGVLPVDRVPAAQVVRRVRDLGLPTDRLVLGVGASAPPSPLTTVREAVATLTGELGVPVVVGALGRELRAGLAPSAEVVDETVARAVTAAGTLHEHLALVAALEGTA